MESLLYRRCRWILIGALIAICAAATGRSHATQFSASPETEVDSCSFTSPSLITWQPKEFECPVCKTKNIFMVWGSYGNYIYQYPSKYQLLFWPLTDSPGWYSCSKCRLSIFMDDFESIPADKIPALRKMLEGTTLPKQPQRSPKESLEDPPYLDLPVSARLAVTEKVYRTLDKSGDEFWNQFYRVVGYHADSPAIADEARKKSIAILARMLAQNSAAGQRKELLYILGAMRHFTGDDPGAKRAFEEAAKEKYENKDLKAEQNSGYGEYLSKLINEYLDMLAKGEGPRQKFPK